MKKILKVLTLVSLIMSSKLFAQVEILGAGATFPYPLYSKMFDVYYKTYGVKINYQSIGSGGGIRQIREKTVDFGASDAFLTDEELKEFSAPLAHIPITAGAVVVAYNLPKNPELKLSSDIIADIFLGKINKWNDKRIKEVNPNITLPDMNITVIHRSDGSGTTFIFSDYLSKVSKEWKEKVGIGKSLNWPTGLGAKGNEGVSGLIKQIPGSIGYIELAYAIENNIPYASIKNKKGNFIKPSLESVSLAAETELPEDMRIMLTDTDADYGYPISGFTWIIVYKDLSENIKSYEKAKELVKLLLWMVNEGQKYTKPLHYAPLSEKAKMRAEKIIKSLTFKGKKPLE